MKTDVFIIGGGIAGLTAGVYALKYGMDVYLCEKNIVGGQIAFVPRIDDYPPSFGVNGMDLSQQLKNWYIENGGKVYKEKAVEVTNADNEFVITTDKNKISSKTLIVANGTDICDQTNLQRKTAMDKSADNKLHNSMFISLTEFDDNGYILTDKYCRTKTPGLYAAGDCRSHMYRWLIIAAADGCVAASEAYKYIRSIRD